MRINGLNAILLSLSVVAAMNSTACGGMGSSGGGGGTPTTVTLQSKPSSVPAGTQITFTANVNHNHHQFLGANWALTMSGAACSSSCGILAPPNNNGTNVSTVLYTAPSTPPNPNSVTITATSIENPSSSDSDTFAIASGFAVATNSLPEGTVGVTYLATLQATGGVPPYGWNVIPGVPAGLALGSDGSITGQPTTAGAYPVMLQVSDSSGVTASANVTITIHPGGAGVASYIGTQSPGDVWLFTLDHLNKHFSASNQTSGTNYGGDISGALGVPQPANGFVKLVVNNSNDPNIISGSTGYAVEDPGVAVMLVLGDPAIAKPIALISQANCPTLLAPVTAGLVNLGKPTYDSAKSESYAIVHASQSGVQYNFSLDSYLLDGTLRGQSGPLPSGTCANGIISVPNVPFGGGAATVTAAIAQNGLYVIDLGPGNGGALGSQTLLSASSIGNITGASYLGAIFRRKQVPITTLVGFGPNVGSTITGGFYQNIDTDPFQAHGNDFSITFAGTNPQGFLTGSLNDALGTHSPFVAIATRGTSNGKLFVFGITTESSNTAPNVILLSEK